MGESDGLMSKDTMSNPAVSDATWNEFVSSIEGGHRAQTTEWAELKGGSGWVADRLSVTSDDRIVAAAQLLTRPVAPLASVGYVQKGPLLTSSDAGLRDEILSAIEKAAHTRKVRYLAMQPADNDQVAHGAMLSRGWSTLDTGIWPTATAAVDLGGDTDELFQAMKSKTRYNIRKAAKKGVTIRQGSRDELPEFHSIASNTSQRQDFGLPSLEYFEQAWDLFDGGHHEIALFFADHEGASVSAILTLGYRQTLTYWRGGWSGASGSAHPNEAIHWHVMQWAKERGYTSYDFDGIDRRIAVPLANGEERPSDVPRSVTDFKIGFGGNVLVYPMPIYRIPNPVLRFSYPVITRVLESPALGSRKFQLTV